MTTDLVAYLRSKPYDPRLQEAADRLEALERVAEAAEELPASSVREFDQRIWNFRAALDALKAGKQGT